MQHQQQRNAKTEAELPALPGRKAQTAPQKNRPQRVHVMGQEGREKNGGADGGPPRRHEAIEGGLGRLERNEQEPVRRQVADDEGKQDEATKETDDVAATSPGSTPSAFITAKVTGSDSASASVGSSQ